MLVHTEANTLRRHGEKAKKLTFTTTTGVSVVTKLDSQLDDHPNTNGDKASASNLGHDLLQVGYIVGGTNQSSCAAKEGVGTSGVHHGVLLSLLNGGAREADITAELLDRK